MESKSEKVKKKYGKRAKKTCYYNDDLCEGAVIRVVSFKKYLCLKCAKEDESTDDSEIL